jgi:hypothetical protein
MALLTPDEQKSDNAAIDQTSFFHKRVFPKIK